MSTTMQRMGCPQKRQLAKDGWCFQNSGRATTQKDPDKTNIIQMNEVFANCSEEDKIFPLTVKEIIEAQKVDNKLKHFFKLNATLDKGLKLRIIKDQKCICNKERLVIPTPLQRWATVWYHHYLQHPGHTRLKETMNAAIYWKGMQKTVRSTTKSCKSCQVNKRGQLKYGHLPSKIVISTPWEALCVDLVCPYTLKGKNGSAIDFMALTMIDPASSWFTIVELPLVVWLTTTLVKGKENFSKEPIFDKPSNQTARLVNKSGCVDTCDAVIWCMTTGQSSNYILKHYANHMA